MSRLIEDLSKVLRPDQMLMANDLKDRFSHIWLMDIPLEAKLLVLPESTQEVSEICRICNLQKQAIVIHGGLTNLVGATKSCGSDVVLSLEKMNKIEEVDSEARTITVQAGAIIEDVQNKARDQGLLFPLNFGAKGTAQIGGSIASNAGGLRVLRYGMCRNLVLGLEVVLADGTIIQSIKKIVKDNSGYDLKHLFIGSEGTLGIVTKAVMKLTELPTSRNSAFAGVNAYAQIVSLLKFMDRELAGSLSGFELIWKDTFEALTSPPSLLKPPMRYDYEYYILIESLGSDHDKDHEVMSKALERAMDKGIIADAVLANSESDLQWFWNIREDVGILNQVCPYDQHFDVSVPIGSIGDYIDGVKKKLKKELNIDQSYAFGHVADGNMHFIIGKKDQSEDLRKAINNIVYEPIQTLMGSVSAEHGIGLDKKDYLQLCKSKAEIALMKQLKKSMDPNYILNPGRIF